MSSSFRPPGLAAGAGTPVSWALVDGVGVYIASPGSPFLTGPPTSNGATEAERALAPPSEMPGDALGHLREPLRREVQGVPVSVKLSDDDVSGLVGAVLNFIARHLPIGRDSSRRVQTGASTP